MFLTDLMKNDEPFGFIYVVPKGAESESKPPCR